MRGLKDKSIIVTGAGSGMGRHTSLMLGKLGARVTVSDMNGEAAEDTARLITGSGGLAQAVVCDVSDEDHVKAMVEMAVATYGGLDGAANCAGRPSHSKMISDLTSEEWNRVIAINLTGAFLCVKYQTAAMVTSGRPGSIVIVSSAAAVKAFPTVVEYAASKAGLAGLMRSAACEFGDRGIRVNAILPGTTDTAMHRSFMAKATVPEERVVSQQLLKRVASADELADAITWLLSDQSSFVTGIELSVDGGLSAV